MSAVLNTRDVLCQLCWMPVMCCVNCVGYLRCVESTVLNTRDVLCQLC